MSTESVHFGEMKEGKEKLRPKVCECILEKAYGTPRCQPELNLMPWSQLELILMPWRHPKLNLMPWHHPNSNSFLGTILCALMSSRPIHEAHHTFNKSEALTCEASSTKRQEALSDLTWGSSNIKKRGRLDITEKRGSLAVEIP